MKKKFVCMMLASTMLVCSACGGQNAQPENEAVVENETDTGNGDMEESSAEAESAASDPSSETENENNEEASDLNVTIQMQTVENEEKASDGTVVYTSSLTYPVVSIQGNETAADKINADIQSRIDTFLNPTDTSEIEYAKEDYEMSLRGEIDYAPPIPYTSNVAYAVTRADNNVISFLISLSSFTGGAHGYTGHQGINYSAKTGELIAFSELTDNPEAFHQDTLAYNQKIAETDVYKERLFTEESIYNGELESTLYVDGSWYLSTSGLTFFSDPYALGPYAAGTIEFTIPYLDLEEMGLKEDYSYSGRLTVKLIAKESYSMDVNGDGTEDKFQFYTDYKDDGSYETMVHFIINGTDFAQSENEEEKEHFIAYAWSNDYGLYDLDETDDFIEFVFLSYFNENDEYLPYNHFFRYEKDGTLTYLGRVQGDFVSPTLDTSNLIQ